MDVENVLLELAELLFGDRRHAKCIFFPAQGDVVSLLLEIWVVDSYRLFWHFHRGVYGVRVSTNPTQLLALLPERLRRILFLLLPDTQHLCPQICLLWCHVQRLLRPSLQDMLLHSLHILLDSPQRLYLLVYIHFIALDNGSKHSSRQIDQLLKIHEVLKLRA